MSVRLTLDAFARRCSGTKDVRVLWRLAFAFFQSRGAVRASYHSNDVKRPGWPPLGIQAEGFSDAWKHQYVQGGLWRSDPIPDLARRIGVPFWFRDIKTLMKLSPNQAKFLEIAAEHNVGEGLAIQLFGPNIHDAFLGLGFGPTRPTMLPAAIFELQSAAQMAHIRYCALTGKLGQQNQSLSPRELEVLRWIARGKSNSVIADIMGISRHTVDTLLRRLFDKLDVNDRTTAVVKGVSNGLLHVDGENVS